MTNRFAAYDANSIYAVADTADGALTKARRDSGTDDAEFDVAVISDELAARIEADGWDGMSQSFDVIGGEIVDTTGA